MNAKTIVFPTDFSESSDAALGYASTLAAESNALLYILHVGEDSQAYVAGYGAIGYTPDLVDRVARENQKLLTQVKPTLPKVRHEHKYLTGTPDQEILGFADEVDADLIVIGSHGRTGISRLLLGSVAEAVVRRANCPVLTIKHPLPEAEEQATPSALQRPITQHLSPVSKHSLH